MNEKWEVTKWAAVIVAIVLVVVVIGFALRPVSMRVEREVLVQSHQYKEGMADRVAVLQATISQIDIQLTTELDEQTRRNLINQRAVINVQLNAARR